MRLVMVLRSALTPVLVVSGVLVPWMVLAKVPAFAQRVTCGELQVPLPGQISNEAPPAVETFTYTWTRGGESGTEDRFDPRQLWEAEQRLGKWTDHEGNTYELVQPQSVVDSFEVGFEQKYSNPAPHVLKEEYKANRREVGKLARKDLPEWLKDWTGKTFGKPQQVRAMGAVRQALIAEAEGMAALIFFLRSDQNQPYALLVTTPKDPPRAWKGTLTRAVGGIAPASKLLKSNRKQEGWNTVEKPPYRVLSNLPGQYAKFVERLLTEMRQMRKIYTTYIPEPSRMKVPVSVIRIFATPEEYHAYAGAGDEWSAGVFSSTHRELVVMGDTTSGSKKEQAEDIRMVTFHEGFHQYLFSITPPNVEVPLWFNEGHATFFETFRRAGKGAGPEPSRRLEDVRRDPRFCSPEGLERLMNFSREAFYQEENRMTAYASSWLLVHWLRTEAPKPLEATLNQYYHLLCEEKTHAEAMEEVYTPEVLAEISKGLREFLRTHRYKP